MVLETLQQILIFYIPILLCACLVLPGHYKASQQFSYIGMSSTQVLTTS